MRFDLEIEEGVTVPCSFGINSTELYCELKGIDLGEVEEHIGPNMKAPDLRDLIYTGIQAAALEDGVECPYNKYKVGQSLNDFFTADGLIDVLAKFGDSLPKFVDKKKVAELVAKVGKPPKKGKATGSKSK